MRSESSREKASPREGVCDTPTEVYRTKHGGKGQKYSLKFFDHAVSRFRVYISLGGGVYDRNKMAWARWPR